MYSRPTPAELALRAVPSIFRLVEPDYSEAGLLLARAAAQAPNDAAILGWWASWHLFLVGQSFAHDPIGACRRAGELAERAVSLDPGCARAFCAAPLKMLTETSRKRSRFRTQKALKLL